MHPVLAQAQEEVGSPLSWLGEVALLDLPRRAVLISRTPRQPAPDTPWVQGLVAAVERLVGAAEVLVTGVARTPFDLALWSAARRGASAIVVLECEAGGEYWTELLPRRHLLVWPKEQLKGEPSLRRRDRLLAALADRAYGVALRDGGNMAQAAQTLRARGASVELWPLSPARSSEVRLVRSRARPELQSAAQPDWAYLTHFTRQPDGAWPGESRGSYLDWLAGGRPYAPRDSFAALCRILREKKLRGCGRLIFAGTPAVCLTALQPAEAGKLRRWRPGLGHWTFSQYGLALRKTALEALGARPVRYAARTVLDQAAPEKRLFLQLERSEKYDWSAEAEWRVPGDVDLRAFGHCDLLALVAHAHEAELIRREFGIAAWVG